ncbi:hypothetical protein [Curtobacterium sp. MCBA15_004]|uniref:hypothetical protein n=1 Tax=unclassified Curtobacterium TaxID=257496 RepID=UPI0008DE4A50|nr:hypothetical protein [Curtobacterium sp. MCBA15_004]WIA98007.1 hypothetical protein QOL16_06370 [Curtobacterium sp. MCBA15_004]
MKQIKTVARTTSLIWIAELAGAFDISRRWVLTGVAAICVSAMALGTALGLATVSTLTQQVPDGIARLMVETATSGSLLSTALVTVILGLATPARSSFDHLLCSLPVTRSARSIGTAIPAAGLAAFGSLALSMPAMLLALHILDVAQSARFLIALFVCMSVVVAIAQTTLQVVTGACRRLLRMPGAIASAVSGAVAISAALLIFGPGVLSPASTGAAAVPTLAGLTADVAVVPGDPLAWVLLGTAAATAAVVVWAASRLPDVKASPPGRALLPTSRFVGGPFGVLAAHLLMLIRAPQTLLAVGGATCFLAVVAWAFPPALPEYLRSAIAAATPAAGCAIIMFAPGRALPTAWVGPPLGKDRRWWVAPAAITHVAVACVVWTVLSGGALWLGLIQVDDLAGMALRGALLFSAAALAGALVPWSDAQPLSGSVALVVTTVLVMGSVGLTTHISETSEQLGLLVTAFITSLLVVAALLAVQNLTRSR